MGDTCGREPFRENLEEVRDVYARSARGRLY